MLSDISLSDLMNPHLSGEEDNAAAATTGNSNMSNISMITKESVNQYVAILEVH